jgi:hypothetical protein
MPNSGEFRATTDQLLGMLDDLRAFEMEKRSLAMGTPEFVASAVQAADQARLVFRWCQMQLEMAHESASRVERGELPSDVHLVAVTPRPIDKILAQWREAQLRLEIARPGSAEAAKATDDIERLREAYQVAHEQHLSAGRRNPA